LGTESLVWRSKWESNRVWRRASTTHGTPHVLPHTLDPEKRCE
jgi:hypothetical protein